MQEQHHLDIVDGEEDKLSLIERGCPFCGHYRLNICGSSEMVWIECETCVAEGPVGKTEQEAVDLWNKGTEGFRTDVERLLVDGRKAKQQKNGDGAC